MRCSYGSTALANWQGVAAHLQVLGSDEIARTRNHSALLLCHKKLLPPADHAGLLRRSAIGCLPAQHCTAPLQDVAFSADNLHMHSLQVVLKHGAQMKSGCKVK